MEQAPKAQREVDAPEKARFWIKRRAQRLQSRSPFQNSLPGNNSEANPNICSMKMALPMGILILLVIVSMGLSAFAIAAEAPLENESNDMESTIKSRSDYPDYDDLSSFFDFEIGPPQITYKGEESSSKESFRVRPNANKNYYYYHSDGYPKYKKYYPAAPKKQVVTPGTHYKSSTEKTFVEGEEKSNESNPILNQAKIGSYQVSIVDADNPIFSKLGLTQEDLAKLTGFKTINTSLLASDSTPTATYAEKPRPNYPDSGYPSPDSPHHNSRDPSKYPTPEGNYGENQHKPNERYPPSETQNPHGDYSRASSSYHPPPQGSYDAKSYKSLQNGYPQGSNSHNYPHPSHNYHSSSPNSYNSPPQPYNNQPQSSYNNPPPPSYNNAPPAPSYSNPPPAPSYNNPQPAPYNHPQSHSASHGSPSSQSYNPQRSSGEPWRPSSQQHTDWDDKQVKKDSWQSNGPYPPHPPPLPYSSTSSNTGTYYPKPQYGTSSDKTGHRYAAPYKPESSSKPTYSSSSSSPEYSSHKPYYPPSTYSSSSKVPSRAGSVSVAASTHHHSPAKPGITISFKAKAPSHGHHHGHSGVNIPLSFSPFEVVKKLLPALNPLNNKKVTIGITIENKKDHPIEFHSY